MSDEPIASRPSDGFGVEAAAFLETLEVTPPDALTGCSLWRAREPGDHRAAFRDIRNYLAGQSVGATRDEALLEDVLRVLFARQQLERTNALPPQGSRPASIVESYREALGEVVERLPELFDGGPRFGLDERSLVFVHERLADIRMEDAEADLIGDAYEAFTGSDMRGQEGQFFTPHGAVNLLIELVQPGVGDSIIDPACGAGGFLAAAARRSLSMSGGDTTSISRIHGIEKDRYLARLATIRMAFFSLEAPNIWCADSIGWRDERGNRPTAADLEGTFDVVLTNPPFGAKIVAASRNVQSGFDLGYQWKPGGNGFIRTPNLARSVPPQVLFMERCVRLVRPGGRIGIVVPESLISGRNYQHVVAWVRERAQIKAVIGMPETLFKSSGKGGTHTKTCLVVMEKHSDHPQAAPAQRVFMAEVRWCGKDSRGRVIERNELPTVAERWLSAATGKLKTSDHLGYLVDETAIVDNILAPRYYDPEVARELESLADTHHLVCIGDLVRNGILSITTGHEVGAAEYGGGPIPFVRTSDISNWEIKLDPKHGVSEEVYAAYAPKQDVRENDILMVRDGTYLVGACALVTKYDTKMVYQSHIFKIRVLREDDISPYLLLAALSSAPVRRQIIAKRFTQDIIDSLGNRVHELILPIPRDGATRERVSAMVKRAIDERVEARELVRQARFEIIGRITEVPDEDALVVE